MLAENNDSDTLTGIVQLPDTSLDNPSNPDYISYSLTFFSNEGVVCNNFAFSLGYYKDILPPFTCKLFSEKSLVDSLPFPEGKEEITLTYLTFSIKYDLKFHISNKSIRYPSYPNGSYKSDTPHHGRWWFNEDDPKTLSPRAALHIPTPLGICTHQSCTHINFANKDTIGFLLQSPPLGLPTRCPRGASEIWIGTTEKCITPLKSPPDASLAPFFVPLPPTNTKGRIFFLESAESRSLSFQFTIETYDADVISFYGPSKYLIKGLSSSPLLVDNYRLHDLYAVFPILIETFNFVENKSAKALLQEGVESTFHTVGNAYGLVERKESNGDHSLYLTPLKVVTSDVIAFDALYYGDKWLETMQSLSKLGMEVIQTFPSLSTQAKEESSADDRRDTAKEISSAGAKKTEEVKSNEKKDRGNLERDDDEDLLGIKSSRARPSEEHREVLPDIQKINAETMRNPSSSNLGRSGDDTHISNVRSKGIGAQQLLISKNLELPIQTNEDKVRMQSTEEQSSANVNNHFINESVIGNLPQQGKTGTQDQRKTGEGSDGRTPYVVAAVLVVALILFLVFRRRGRRAQKSEKRNENSVSEEFLASNTV